MRTGPGKRVKQMSLILSTLLTGIGLGLGFAIGDNIIRHSVEALRNWWEMRQIAERWQEIDQRCSTPDICKQTKERMLGLMRRLEAWNQDDSGMGELYGILSENKDILFSLSITVQRIKVGDSSSGEHPQQ